jgi:hypothetical protein
MRRNLPLSLAALLLPAFTNAPAASQGLSEIPANDTYCLEAQRIVTRTDVPMQLVVHADFEAFVKSKAVIEGPTIHQYNWLDADDNIQGISCKMKSADHLNIQFGGGSAGPDGLCHDMNYQVYKLLLQNIEQPAYDPTTFDLNEKLVSEEQSSMIGPEWLLPFTLTYLDAADGLHVATKGFVIEFSDQRFQKFPDSWRGTHYCHLIAPEYLQRLLQGTAEPGAVVGRAAKQRNNPVE